MEFAVVLVRAPRWITVLSSLRTNLYKYIYPCLCACVWSVYEHGKRIELREKFWPRLTDKFHSGTVRTCMNPRWTRASCCYNMIVVQEDACPCENNMVYVVH